MTVPRVPFIETRDLTRTFGRHYALHRVSLRLEAGRVALLLGPNGAGKSTLLAILATLDTPDRGEVRFGDLGLAAMARHGRGLIGWVSHDSLVYGELSAYENLLFYGRLYGLSGLDARVDALLQRVGLAEAAHRPVQGFSRGMRQRLSVARALLNDPHILLLDEPFNGLDHDGRARVLEVLGQCRDQGALVVLSTHLLELPAGFVDHVVVLRNGRLLFDGPPGESLAAQYEAVLEGRWEG